MPYLNSKGQWTADKTNYSTSIALPRVPYGSSGSSGSSGGYKKRSNYIPLSFKTATDFDTTNPYTTPTDFRTATHAYLPGSQTYTPKPRKTGLSDEELAVVLKYSTVNPKYLSNTTNGFAYNSLADVAFNTAAQRKRWKDTAFDPETWYGAVLFLPRLVADTGLMLKEQLYDPIAGSVKLANYDKTDDYTINDAIKTGLATAGLNLLINVGNTLDAFSNPIKGAIIEGTQEGGLNAWEGFLQGAFGTNTQGGISEEGRKTYDYNDVIDNGLLAFLAEIASDPTNWATLGAKALSTGGAKATAKAGTEAASEVIEAATKATVKDISDDVASEVTEAAVRSVADDVTKFVVKGSDDVERSLIAEINRIYNKYGIDVTYEEVENMLKGYVKDGVLDVARMKKGLDVGQKMISKGLKKSLSNIDASDISAFKGVALDKNFFANIGNTLDKNALMRIAVGGGKKQLTPELQHLLAKEVSSLAIDKLPTRLLVSKYLRALGDAADDVLQAPFKMLLKPGIVSAKYTGKAIKNVANKYIPAAEDLFTNLSAKYYMPWDLLSKGDVTDVTSISSDIIKHKEAQDAIDEVFTKLQDDLFNSNLTPMLRSKRIENAKHLLDAAKNNIDSIIKNDNNLKALNISNISEYIAYLKNHTDDINYKTLLDKLSAYEKELSKTVDSNYVSKLSDAATNYYKRSKKYAEAALNNNITEANFQELRKTANTIRKATETSKLVAEAKARGVDAEAFVKAKKLILDNGVKEVKASMDTVREVYTTVRAALTNTRGESIPGNLTEVDVIDTLDTYYDYLKTAVSTEGIDKETIITAYNNFYNLIQDLTAFRGAVDDISATNQLGISRNDLMRGANRSGQGLYVAFEHADLRHFLDNNVKENIDTAHAVYTTVRDALADAHDESIPSDLINTLNTYYDYLEKAVFTEGVDKETIATAYNNFYNLIQDLTALKEELYDTDVTTLIDIPHGDDYMVHTMATAAKLTDLRHYNVMSLVDVKEMLDYGVVTYTSMRSKSNVIKNIFEQDSVIELLDDWQTENSVLKKFFDDKSIQDNPVIKTLSDTLDNLVEYKNVSAGLKQQLDAVHSLDELHKSGILDAFLTALNTPYAFSERNLTNTIEDIINKSELYYGAKQNAPTLSMDYVLTKLYEQYIDSADPIKSSIAKQIKASLSHAHTAEVDNANWFRALQLNESWFKELDNMLQDGDAVFIIDTETTSDVIDNLEVYQFSFKVVKKQTDVATHQTKFVEELSKTYHIKVTQQPSAGVITKLMSEADDYNSASELFINRYIKGIDPNVPLVTFEDAINDFNIIAQQYNLERSVVAGQNITRFDIPALIKNSNNNAFNSFISKNTFDSYKHMAYQANTKLDDIAVARIKQLFIDVYNQYPDYFNKIKNNPIDYTVITNLSEAKKFLRDYTYTVSDFIDDDINDMLSDYKKLIETYIANTADVMRTLDMLDASSFTRETFEDFTDTLFSDKNIHTYFDNVKTYVDAIYNISLRDPDLLKQYGYNVDETLFKEFNKYYDYLKNNTGAAAQKVYNMWIDYSDDAFDAADMAYRTEVYNNFIAFWDTVMAINKDTTSATALLKTISNATESTVTAAVDTGDAILDILDRSVSDVLEIFNASKILKNSNYTHSITKNVFDTETIDYLVRNQIINAPGVYNILNLYLKNTGTNEIFLNPRTLTSYVFSDYFDPKKVIALGKRNIEQLLTVSENMDEQLAAAFKTYVTGGLDLTNKIDVATMSELTRMSRKINTIKRRLTTAQINSYYDDAVRYLDLLKTHGTSARAKYSSLLYDANGYNKADIVAAAKYFKNEAKSIDLNKVEVLSETPYKTMRVLSDSDIAFLKDMPNRLISKKDISGAVSNIEDVIDKKSFDDFYTHSVTNTLLEAEENIEDMKHMFEDPKCRGLYKNCVRETINESKNLFDSFKKYVSENDTVTTMRHIRNYTKQKTQTAVSHRVLSLDAPERFIKEARYCAGRMVVQSDTALDLSHFDSKRFITNSVKVKDFFGNDTFLNFIYVRKEYYQTVITRTAELSAEELEASFTANNIKYTVSKLIDPDTKQPLYKYYLNGAEDLSDDYLKTVHLVDTVGEAIPEDLQNIIRELEQDYNRLGIYNVGYSNGSLLDQDIIEAIDAYMPGASVDATPVSFLTSTDYFNKPLTNNIVLGDYSVQRLFNKYVASNPITQLAQTTKNVIKQYTNNTALYINFMFNSENGMNTLLKGLKDKDVLALAKANEDKLSFCYLAKSKHTASGFEVRTIPIINSASVKLARERNAHVLTPDLVYQLQGAINSYRLPKMLKFVSQLSNAYKVGYLASPGWVLRNMIDSNYKNHGDLMSTIGNMGQVTDFFESTKILLQHQNMMKTIKRPFTDVKEYNALYNLLTMSADEFATYYKGLTDIDKLDFVTKRYLDSFMKALSDSDKLSLKNNLLEPDMFKFVDDFIKQGPSAGIVRSVQNNVTTDGAINKVLHYFTDSKYSPVTYLFDANDMVEQSARFSRYVAEIQHGATLSEATQAIIKTHFDYSDKTYLMMLTETFVPFLSFSFKNLEYWIDTLYNNGQMIHELENIFRTVFDYHSLYNPDYEVYNAYDYRFNFKEDVLDTTPSQPWQLLNASRLYHLLQGNIVIDTGKDKKETDAWGNDVTYDINLVFKLSPSMLDACNMLINPLDEMHQRLLPPYKAITDIVDAAFSGKTIDVSEEFNKISLLNNLPYVGALTTRMGVGQTHDYLTRIEDAGMLAALSSVFGVSYVKQKKYNTWYDDDNQYLTKLPAKDKKYYQSKYNKSSKWGGLPMYYSAKRANSIYTPNATRFRVDTLARYSKTYNKDYNLPSAASRMKYELYSDLYNNSPVANDLIYKRIKDHYELFK